MEKERKTCEFTAACDTELKIEYYICGKPAKYRTLDREKERAKNVCGIHKNVANKFYKRIGIQERCTELN